MVNIIIYLAKEHDAKYLVDTMLNEQLIANATIDMDNISFNIENNHVISTENTVITAQTRSMLISKIENFIASKYGENVRICSIPIIHANNSFDALIRNNTLKE